MNGFMHTEATGVFSGTLLEDMVETVKKTKKLYCDVDIPSWYNPKFRHPLTYVPLWAFGLPLRKGDKVKVRFEQGDLCNPVLWKVEDAKDFDVKELYEKWNIPDFVSGGNARKPEAEAPVNAEWLGKDCYVIHTESYTVLHQNNGFVLIDKDDRVVVRGKGMDIVSVDELNVDAEKEIRITGNKSLDLKLNDDMTVDTKGKSSLTAANDIYFKSTSGKVGMGNNVGSIYDVLGDIYDKLNDIAKDVAKMKTAGAPTNHVVSPDDIATFTALSGQITASKTKMQQVFKS